MNIEIEESGLGYSQKAWTILSGNSSIDVFQKDLLPLAQKLIKLHRRQIEEDLLYNKPTGEH
jgi:hypothetical protein